MIRQSVFAFVLICLSLTSAMIDEALGQKLDPCKKGEFYSASAEDSTETLAVCYLRQDKLPVSVAKIFETIVKVVEKVNATKIDFGRKKIILPTETIRVRVPKRPALRWDFESNRTRYAGR